MRMGCLSAPTPFPSQRFVATTRVAIALMLALASTARAGVNRWTTAGPSGGSLRLAMDPSNPEMLYAAGQSAGVLRRRREDVGSELDRDRHADLTLTLAAAVVFGLAMPAADELPPDLAEAVKNYEAAQVRSDVAALAQLVSDDFLLVNSDSSVQDKDSFLADFRKPGFHLDSYVVEEGCGRSGATRRSSAAGCASAGPRTVRVSAASCASRTSGESATAAGRRPTRS